jgi:hypothetical protein
MNENKKEVKVEKAVIVCQSAMMRRSVANELKNHVVQPPVCCDEPSKLNGQLKRNENNRVILLLLTGLEKDPSWTAIELKCRFPSDTRLVRMNKDRPDLRHRLCSLGFDESFNLGDDVWEVIQKVLSSKHGSIENSR